MAAAGESVQNGPAVPSSSGGFLARDVGATSWPSEPDQTVIDMPVVQNGGDIPTRSGNSPTEDAGTTPPNICLLQMKNLVNMQVKKGDTAEVEAKKRVALEALKEWKESVTLQEGRHERRSKQTDKLIYEVYQLVGLYSVFVGVVFAAVLQSARVKCQHIWSPVLLCCLAWVVIILITNKKFKKIQAQRKIISDHDTARQVAFAQISKLKKFGHEKFSFTKDIGIANRSAQRRSDQQKSDQRKITIPWVIRIALTVFTLALVGSFIHILCL